MVLAVITGSNAFSEYGRGGKSRGDAAPRTDEELLDSGLLILISFWFVGAAERLVLAFLLIIQPY
jgi:hypothetical protein